MLVVDGVEVLEVREAAAYVRRTPETVRRRVWSRPLAARRRGNRLLGARRDLDALVRPSEGPELDLAGWPALLPEGSGKSAAELVLSDRRSRSEPPGARR